MKHNKAATITSGIDARNPPTLPVCKAETLLGTCGTTIGGYYKKQGLYAQNWCIFQLIRILL